MCLWLLHCVILLSYSIAVSSYGNGTTTGKENCSGKTKKAFTLKMYPILKTIKTLVSLFFLLWVDWENIYTEAMEWHKRTTKICYYFSIHLLVSLTLFLFVILDGVILNTNCLNLLCCFAVIL